MGKEHTSSYGALAGQSTPPPGLSSGTQGFSSLIICTSTLPYNTTTLDKNEVQLHNRNASRPEQMSEHNAMPGRHGHYPDSAPLQFLAPYAGCTIAEYFRDRLGGCMGANGVAPTPCLHAQHFRCMRHMDAGVAAARHAASGTSAHLEDSVQALSTATLEKFVAHLAPQPVPLNILEAEELLELKHGHRVAWQGSDLGAHVRQQAGLVVDAHGARVTVWRRQGLHYHGMYGG